MTMTQEQKPDKAFPQLRKDAFGDMYSTGGMDLRDYFAGQALAGMLRFQPRDLKTWNDVDEWAHGVCVANIAYKLADAMMKARKQ